jgi:hypothetical protein
MLVQKTLRALNVLTDLFERAASFEGRPRERLMAVVEAEEQFFRLHPYHYRALQLVRVASQLAHPAERRDSLARCESRRMALLTGIIGDAARCGDLVLQAERRPADLAFILWSLAFGTRALMNTQVATTQLGIRDGFETAREFADELMDTLGWRPLSTEWDYGAVRLRIQHELFRRDVRLPRSVN